AGANERDWFRAALKAIQRSIITPIDHPDIMNRMITTTFARMPICFQSEIGSQPTEPSSKSQAAKMWKLQSATAARFTTMGCFSSSELFRTRFQPSPQANPLYSDPGPLVPASVSQHGQNRLMQENQSGRNRLRVPKRHHGFPSREKVGRGGLLTATN